MSSANASGDLSSEMEVDAFRRLFPLCFHERHLLESVRPDARKLGKARDTTLALVFCVVLLSWTLKYFVFVQTMLAAIKMEVMTPTIESPDKGCRGAILGQWESCLDGLPGRRSYWQTREQKGMSSVNAYGDLSSEMEVDAFRRLFLLRFHERHLLEFVRPDARKLWKARDTTLALGVVASVDGSALAKIGCTRSSLGKRVGFVKFNADVVDKATGKKVPGIVFARGPAVTVLILLESDGNTYAVLTEQVLCFCLYIVEAMGGHHDSGSSVKKSIGVANDVPTFNAENMQNNMKAVYYSRTRSKGGVFHPFML
ncbi:hypothetical protein LOK49_LG10G00189 [Camellia lanceoleosa]|uniref:Uncharacterized protein n=1 Tax=Camellia lanceoleosa TaxID=1840588 RepID=A0ACC0G8M4_9ERIC|nr:hypothetical protein LOK49_LG10G00189 [Camellia lanceoleosa]